MNKIFDNNMDELRKRAFLTVDNYEKYLEDAKEYEEYVKVEDNIMYFKYEDKWLQLNSCFLKDEVDMYMRGVPADADNLVILLGIGNVELLTRIFLQATNDTRILIIEPNIYVMRYVLEKFDITWAIQSEIVRFAFGDSSSIEAMIRSVRVWENLAYNVKCVQNPNYYMYKNDLIAYLQLLRKTLCHSILSQGNDMDDRLQIFDSSFHNIENMFECNSIDEIEGKYEGYPAFIVASGPSLEKNIENLKKACGKAIIIACDASNKMCLEHGIVPDVIASLERGEAIYEYFFKDKEIDESSVLVGATSLCMNIFKEFKGKKIMTTRLDNGFDMWIQKFFPNVRFLSQGHSCAHTAFSTAYQMGCDPIVFVGQDLAYTDDKCHSDKIQELLGTENKPTDGRLVVKDIYGEDVKTSSVLKFFLEWFEARVGEINAMGNREVIDATEGGALIKGTKIMTLKDTIEKYCTRPIENKVCDILNDVKASDTARVKKYKEILSFSKKERKNIGIVKNICRKEYKKMDKVLDDVESVSVEELVALSREVSKAIEHLKKHENILSFYRVLLHQISMKIRAIGNTINKDNMVLNIAYLHYLMNGIVQISNLLIPKYDDLIEYLECRLFELNMMEDTNYGRIKN